MAIFTEQRNDSIIGKILNRLIKSKERLTFSLAKKRLFRRWVSDETFLKLQYQYYVKKPLDLSSPKTFNEKIQWLKLYGNLQEYTHLVDKYAVRKHIAETIGEEYLIPLIGVWDSFDDIDFNSLPEQFVLKCTHDSGSVITCTDKAVFNIKVAREKLSRCLKQNFYYTAREVQYKNIKPRIICEKYMVNESGEEFKDYKIFCFNGIPKIIEVDYDRFTIHKRNLYDIEWNYLSVSLGYPTDPKKTINKPNRLENILKLAKVLAKDYPHVRVDFYLIDDRIYFGELTFTHAAGYQKFEPEEFDLQMGSWIELPNK